VPTGAPGARAVTGLRATAHYIPPLSLGSSMDRPHLPFCRPVERPTTTRAFYAHLPAYIPVLPPPHYRLLTHAYDSRTCARFADSCNSLVVAFVAVYLFHAATAPHDYTGFPDYLPIIYRTATVYCLRVRLGYGLKDWPLLPSPWS